MTDESKKPDKSEKPVAQQPADVGFGRPPAQHRFKKGVSGNPKGRPRKIAPSYEDYLGKDESFRNIFLQMAYQEVTVRSGDGTLQMPAAIALQRNLIGQALAGNLKAQDMVMSLVQDIERGKAQDRAAAYKTMLDYKIKMEEELEVAASTGKPARVMIPHPSDIEVDFVTLTFTINGPKTQKEYDKVAQLRDFLTHLAEQISWFELMLSQTPDDESLKTNIAQDRSRFERLNAELPTRLRLKLEGEEAPRWPDLFARKEKPAREP